MCIYVYICVYMCIYVYICVYMCIYVYICVYMCIYVYMYICIYVYMYTCIYVYMYICIYVYMYICIYVYMYICIHVYMYMQLENGSERGHKRKSYATSFNQSRQVLSSTVFPRIANHPTHPWLRSSRANKGPLPEWERQRTNNLTARR